MKTEVNSGEKTVGKGNEPSSTISVLPISQTVGKESKFTGGAFVNFFIGLLMRFVSIVTLGLAYPAMMCWKMRWKAAHTYVKGRRLVFDGKAGQLFGKYIFWLLLSLVTLGIYAMIFMPLRLRAGEAKHTHFEGADEKSIFDGSIWGLFGVNFVSGLVTAVTLGIGSFWARCYKERWYRKHQVIDGCRLTFGGTGMQYFGKCIVWVLLTVVTLGIYSFWLIVKKENWVMSHISTEDILPEVSQEVLQRQAAFAPKKAEKPDKLSVISFISAFLILILIMILYLIFGEPVGYNTLSWKEYLNGYLLVIDINIAGIIGVVLELAIWIVALVLNIVAIKKKKIKPLKI